MPKDLQLVYGGAWNHLPRLPSPGPDVSLLHRHCPEKSLWSSWLGKPSSPQHLGVLRPPRSQSHFAFTQHIPGSGIRDPRVCRAQTSCLVYDGSWEGPTLSPPLPRAFLPLSPSSLLPSHPPLSRGLEQLRLGRVGLILDSVSLHGLGNWGVCVCIFLQ